MHTEDKTMALSVAKTVLVLVVLMFGLIAVSSIIA